LVADSGIPAGRPASRLGVAPLGDSIVGQGGYGWPMYRLLPMILLAALALATSAQAASPADRAVPRFAHVIVIVEENKDFAQIADPAVAPNFNRLAKAYGQASKFYGEVHPSEANYLALLAGDTFGIHDDDAFYCHAGLVDPWCAFANQPAYPDHTIRGPHLGAQLEARGLTWKGYFESLPEPGSLAVIAGGPPSPKGSRLTALYASKHSGFVNFESVQKDPRRAEHLQGFPEFEADLAADRLPSFALLIPNQCNEMHGLRGEGVPADCDGANVGPLIRRGDRVLGELVARIQGSAAWRAKSNFAIVITFDEGSGGGREGCCAVTPDAPSNYGGGHIPTIVITNHGPRGLTDDTPYNHYSLLRTLEDAFGLPAYLGHAADTDKGVVPMTRLFGGR
jgi:hypothetical protein